MIGPQVFYESGTLVQGTRVLRECEPYVRVRRDGSEVVYRKYELECLCGRVIKRKVGEIGRALRLGEPICCIECREVVYGKGLRQEGKPKAEVRLRPLKPRGRREVGEGLLYEDGPRFRSGDLVCGAIVLGYCGYREGRRGLVREVELECQCGAVIRRSEYYLEYSRGVGRAMRCRVCSGASFRRCRSRDRSSYRGRINREQYIEDFRRHGTLWTIWTTQILTEDIAEASGLELGASEAIPWASFNLYDGEPVVTSLRAPTDDDSD